MPIAGCKPGHSWQDAANFVRKQHKARFGAQVEVQYVDFLPPRWKDFPKTMELINNENAQIPIITIDDEVFSTGGMISVGKIAKKLEQLGIKRGEHDVVEQ